MYSWTSFFFLSVNLFSKFQKLHSFFCSCFLNLAKKIYFFNLELLQCQLFAKDDGSPPPNCNPFDSAASFTCFSVSKGVEVDQSLDFAFSEGGNPLHRPGQMYFWSDKSLLVASPSYDCRKLENGCFSSHSRWPPCLCHGKQKAMPNPVVYVPRRSSITGSNNNTSPPVSGRILHDKCKGGGIADDWTEESQGNFGRKSSFSSASTASVTDCSHSPALSLLQLSDSQA